MELHHLPQVGLNKEVPANHKEGVLDPVRQLPDGTGRSPS